MPASYGTAKGQENSSGVVRNGKGYIIDGKEVKGIMLRWKRYKNRIVAMEREAGFRITKKGSRVSLGQMRGLHNKKQKADDELSKKSNDDQAESETESSGSKEALTPTMESEKAKKKAPPKSKKKPAKRPRTVNDRGAL